MVVKDLAIIGGGPAGITAAVYAARKKMDFTVIAKDIGGQAAWSASIENYPGFQFIGGLELVDKFRTHLENYKFELLEGTAAVSVKKAGDTFEVECADGTRVRARTVIIASGKKPRELGVPGEKEYRNKGVHYCATCDGAIFGGKVVAVVGGGNSALDAAISMMKIASKVYLVNISPQLTGDAVMREKVEKAGNVEVLNEARTVEIKGDKFVTGIVLEHNGSRRELPVQGVFVEAGLVPNSGIIDCADKNKTGEIMIDCGAQTSCPGIFAAGDVTDVPDKQIVIAAGDGAKAALSAFKYISTH